MATTTLRPPTPTAPKRAKSFGGNPVVIILAVVCVLLAGGAGFFLVQNNELTAKLNQTREGLINVADAAGSGALTAEDLQNPELAAGALGNLTSEIEGMVAELENTRAEVSRQRGQLNEANAALEASSVQTSSLRGQVQDLREELQTVRNETASLTEQHQQEVSELNGQISSMEAATSELNARAVELESAVAAANEEIDRLRKQLASRPASPATASANAGEPAGSEEEISSEEELSTEAVEELSMKVPDGASRYFSTIFFNKANSTLSLTALDGRTLTYFDVPVELYDGLAAAPVLDVFFRFRLLDQFASDPADIDFIRSLD